MTKRTKNASSDGTKTIKSSENYINLLSNIADIYGLYKAFETGFQAKLAKEGETPEVLTVVYVHGIGNKPVASVLKCQWDTALFGSSMGDLTRMAYWVNRNRYPTPESGSCGSKDAPLEEKGAIQLKTLEATDIQSTALPSDQQEIMDSLERKLLRSIQEQTSGPRAKLLPLPEGMRRWITKWITERFLKDVRDFLFDAEQRSIMERSLLERIEVGGGPFIIIGHSQGSMVAYHVLRQLQKEQCDVRLFVTIGSPLGLQEVQDVLKKLYNNKTLSVPECVDRWFNVAERLDPVALDANLSNDYSPNSRKIRIENEVGLQINPEWDSNPHSVTGYLRIESVRKMVRDTVGSAFFNLIGSNVLMKDLVANIEDSSHEQRHSTLIQLVPSDSASRNNISLEETRNDLEAQILNLLGAKGIEANMARIQHMRHFISADLTRSEIETLRSLCDNLKIERIWKNAVKRALVHQSVHTIQVKTANMGYGAKGQDIAWAILDTGIAAGHPHFKEYKNVISQWDCTKDAPPKQLKSGDTGFDNLDGNGHGTHVAATIAGGMTLLDKENKKIELYGMAQEAKLYGFKVLKDNGNGEDAYIIKALDIIADLNEKAGRLVIQGVNLSLGGNFDPSVFGCGHTPLCQELRRLWRQGVLVCLAAGNEGYTMLNSEDGFIPANMDLTIGDPANLQEAIAVGSMHKTNPHTYGVSYFSSRGPTADGRMKPDLVAPGENILSARHKWPTGTPKHAKDYYVEMSGTSMATPHVSGLLAAFLSARREFIGYPDRVKELLLKHCTDLDRDPYIQGRGMPNLVKMLMNT